MTTDVCKLNVIDFLTLLVKRVFGEKLPGEAMKEGNCYFVRTCTHYTLGRLKHLSSGELIFEEASWIPNSGRWHNLLANGPDELDEVEPYVGLCYVARQSIVDYTDWCHDLPNKQK